MSIDSGFSFPKKSFDDIHKQIDKKLDKKQKKSIDEDMVEKEVDSRIRIAHEIKNHPPKPGYMKVDVSPAIYSIDLNTDAHWFFNHVCTVFPLLLDQAIRTHVDVRDSFKPQKRKLDFQYWWVILLPVGLILILYVLSTFGLI
jgi:hypothetical protein